MKFSDAPSQRLLERTINTGEIISPALSELVQGNPNFIADRHRLVDEDTLRSTTITVLKHMEELKHPYHNHLHVRTVLAHALELSRYAGLNAIDAQLLEMAALFHDYGHSGCTFRQYVPDIEAPHLSNEEFAAQSADRIIGPHLSLFQRITLQGLILATSFGQNQPEKVPVGMRAIVFRPYRPITVLEKLLAFADVLNSLRGWDVFVEESILLLREEGHIASTLDFSSYLAGQLQFINYLRGKLDEIIEVLPSEISESYQHQLEALERHMEVFTSDPERDTTPLGKVFHELKGSGTTGSDKGHISATD